MCRQRVDEFSRSWQIKLERIDRFMEFLGSQAPGCPEDAGANGLALAGRQLRDRCLHVK